MKKVFKRIAAMSAAVMMMASISSMGVSAVTVTYSVGGYSLQCGASKTTANGLFISSAVTDQSVTVNVSGKAKYYYNNKYITTGNGNSGKAAITAVISKKGGSWISLDTQHMVNSKIKKISSSIWKALEVF